MGLDQLVVGVRYLLVLPLATSRPVRRQFSVVDEVCKRRSMPAVGNAEQVVVALLRQSVHASEFSVAGIIFAVGRRAGLRRGLCSCITPALRVALKQNG